MGWAGSPWWEQFSNSYRNKYQEGSVALMLNNTSSDPFLSIMGAGGHNMGMMLCSREAFTKYKFEAIEGRGGQGRGPRGHPNCRSQHGEAAPHVKTAGRSFFASL
jgi:hypothetical protein